MKKISIASSILVALVAQAHAEPGKEGDKWVGGFAEYYSVDKEASGFPLYVTDGLGLGAEFGFRFKPQWAARLEYSHLNINASPLGKDQSMNRFGADAMYFLPNDSLYVFGGIKNINMAGDNDQALDYGLGKHWALNDRVKLVTEVAAYNNLNNGQSNVGVKLGIAYTFGDSSPSPSVAQSLPMDSDNDGVNDNLDMCPNTPAGTPVNGRGCSLTVDSDNDGVADSKDKCANTPTTDKVDSDGCSIFVEKEVSQNLKVNFAKNSYAITNPNNPEFQEFADFMKRYPNTDTVIEGHASAPGEAAYNLWLSKKRADAGRELFIDKYGIDGKRITTVGYGETQLLDESNTPEADAKNRRIVAKVSASKRVKELKD